jgi:hypothetical protein
MKENLIYWLSDYDWERVELLATNKKTYKIRVSVPWHIVHERLVPKEKCAFPDEKVCVVWETWKGVNGRGGYRVEREKYPQHRIPARLISRQHCPNNQNGRVTE